VRRNNKRLQDILDAIDAIERYTKKGKQTFIEQELIQVWIVHHLQIIGEATNALSNEIVAGYPEISWVQIVALRNFVVHEYFRIDPQVIWDITQEDLIPLKVTVERILKNYIY
jgi:uncharacterized protein with HEPN domain